MDYSKFLDENFDVKDWVNTALRTQEGTSTKDQYATTLVMKLQMFIQEVNNVIEEACQQAINNLPRVQREMEAVRQESALLQEQMTMVKQDIQKVEHDTAQSMQMLLRIDSIKSRMKAASQALQEADNWTTLSADVEDVFQSQDINAISQRLVGMQQSLQMLVDVPDYTERCQHLESLKNRLEAMLSPQLVGAFNAQSLDGAQMYVRLFTDIDRLSQLYKYYHKCHKAQLLQSWRTIRETSPDSTLMEWLPDFYDTLLSTWHSQIQWCHQVFSNPVPIVTELVVDTLDSMDPSFPTCIAVHLQSSPETLTTLIDLKQISERFAKSMEVALEPYLHDPQHVDSINKLAKAVYVPFKLYVSKYGSFEDALLMKELDNIMLDHSEVMDCVRLLGESVTKLFGAADKAVERCIQFTNGCGFVGLLTSLESYFKNYLREFRRVLTNLREKCNIGSSSVDAEDWSLFQHSLRIIQTCGDLIMHTDELDQTLISGVLSSVGKFCAPRSPTAVKGWDKRVDPGGNPFHHYSILLLESRDDQVAVKSLVNMLEEGDTPSLLEGVKQQMCALSEEVHKFAFDIVFAPLQQHLAHLPEMEIWTSQTPGGALTSDLPTFSLSPQEYITKIGQYLMTLPQQLEPFTMQDHPALTVALKHGRLPFTNPQELPEHLADLWLESIANGTMHNYCEQILMILELTPHATKQLITDIDYLCNVLDDIGLHASETLTNIDSLLKTPQREYSEVHKQMPQRLASGIANMRNLRLE